MIDWAKHQYPNSVTCKFMPREGEGFELKPELAKYKGNTVHLTAMWMMDEDDPYPNEWALGCKNGRDDVFPDTTWIASGDVEIVNE